MSSAGREEAEAGAEDEEEEEVEGTQAFASQAFDEDEDSGDDAGLEKKRGVAAVAQAALGSRTRDGQPMLKRARSETEQRGVGRALASLAVGFSSVVVGRRVLVRCDLVAVPKAEAGSSLHAVKLELGERVVAELEFPGGVQVVGGEGGSARSDTFVWTGTKVNAALLAELLPTLHRASAAAGSDPAWPGAFRVRLRDPRGETFALVHVGEPGELDGPCCVAAGSGGDGDGGGGGSSGVAALEASKDRDRDEETARLGRVEVLLPADHAGPKLQPPASPARSGEKPLLATSDEVAAASKLQPPACAPLAASDDRPADNIEGPQALAGVPLASSPPATQARIVPSAREKDLLRQNVERNSDTSKLGQSENNTAGVTEPAEGSPKIAAILSPLVRAVETECAPAPEPVHFSAFAPMAQIGTEFIVTAWVHRQSELGAVIEAERAEGREKKHAKLGLVIPPSAKLEVRVDGHSTHLEPLVDADSIARWDDRRANTSFLISCKEEARAGRPCFLRLRLFVDGEDFGQLPVLVNVEGAPAEAEPRAVWVYPRQRPHIFISYRRTHADLADRVRLYLESQYGYQVFLDIAPQRGIRVGNYQEQLEDNLARAAVFVPLLTPAPSGTDARRATLSYLGCVSNSAAAGIQDWCYRELQLALEGYSAGRKVIVPLHRGIDLGTEFGTLPEDVRQISALQAIELNNNYFQESVASLHDGVQWQLRKVRI